MGLYMSATTSDLYKPSIGMKGLYEVAAPYGALLTPYKEYECTGVNSLTDELRSGEDPLHDIYLKSGDSQLSYNNDINVDMPIVTLTSAYGDVIKFPLRALVKPPMTDTTAWHTIAITAVLPALPVDYDLTSAVTVIEERMSGMFGINKPNVYVSTIGTPSLLTKAVADKITKARRAAIDDYKSDRVRLQTALAENAILRSRIEQMEKYVISMKA